VTGSPYRILMVCTGNVCRSPVMERLLRARIAYRLPAEQAARFAVPTTTTLPIPTAGGRSPISEP
jgi:protein-tyrosine-phosphatase